MQFFLSKRDEKSLRKLLPFQQNGHIGVMRRARAKEMALAMPPAPQKDAVRDVTRPQKECSSRCHPPQKTLPSAKRITPC